MLFVDKGGFSFGSGSTLGGITSVFGGASSASAKPFSFGAAIQAATATTSDSKGHH